MENAAKSDYSAAGTILHRKAPVYIRRAHTLTCLRMSTIMIINDDPFVHVPCCCAGMNGGCRWHVERLLEASRWTVPKLELANMDYDIGESLRRPRVHGSECSQGETILCTFHLGGRIVIQEEWCQQIQVHVERYLLGHAMWDED